MYTLTVVEEIFQKQILYDYQCTQGIHEENEIHLQQQCFIIFLSSVGEF